MERQNITLALPKALLKRVKSISQLLKETLEKRLRTETNFKSAKRRQLALLKQGFDLGTKGRMNTTRETLHERR